MDTESYVPTTVNGSCDRGCDKMDASEGKREVAECGEVSSNPPYNRQLYSGRLALPPPKVSSLRSGLDRYDAGRAVFFCPPSMMSARPFRGAELGRRALAAAEAAACVRTEDPAVALLWVCRQVGSSAVGGLGDKAFSGRGSGMTQAVVVPGSSLWC